MSNYDITFCSNPKCKNMKCDRNQKNYDFNMVALVKPYISIANFEECEFWENKDE